MSRILTAVLAVAAVCCLAAIASADVCAPAKVTDLSVVSMGKTTAVLNFTDSGDDCLTGTATSYEVRFSTGAITESNYYSCSIAGTGSPSGSGGTTGDCFNVPLNKLTCGGNTYYFAITFTDAAGNRSPVSNSPSGSTRACNGAEVFCP